MSVDERPGSTSRRVPGALAVAALRASLATSSGRAITVIAAGLVASWGLTMLLGGAQHVVPHFYYAPILFTAVRFGAPPTLVVALLSGILAGPFTPLDVMTDVAQETDRWLTRLAFFLTIGVGMSALVRPSLPSISEELARRRDERRIREGITRGEFLLRYQPIVSLESGRLTGVEALVRWQHPERGELAPEAFLPAAEATGAIHDLGALVFDTACRQAARWRELADAAGVEPPCVAINLSVRELDRPELIRRVRDTMVQYQVEPSQICLELTESVLVEDVEVSTAQLAGLKTLGVRLAVDDFGTGYSSLSAVHRFPVDVLKIDRSFLADITDTTTVSLLGGLQLFAWSLGLDTIVEGVETEAQRELLLELGYTSAQGYLFSWPLTSQAVDELLTARRRPASEREQGRSGP